MILKQRGRKNQWRKESLIYGKKSNDEGFMTHFTENFSDLSEPFSSYCFIVQMEVVQFTTLCLPNKWYLCETN